MEEEKRGWLFVRAEKHTNALSFSPLSPFTRKTPPDTAPARVSLPASMSDKDSLLLELLGSRSEAATLTEEDLQRNSKRKGEWTEDIDDCNAADRERESRLVHSNWSGDDVIVPVFQQGGRIR